MSTNRIAIVTAPNMRFVNTGMTTVELAARSTFGQKFWNADLNFYSIVPPNPPGNKRWMMMDLGYPHRSARGVEELFCHRSMFECIEEVLSSDLIVYWGDFLQAKHYIEHEAVGRLKSIHGLSASDAQEFAYNALLLARASPSARSNSIVFGSSLLYNRVSDYLSGPYSKSLKTLVLDSRLSAFRDPMSAHRMNHLTGDYDANYVGIDPAFLLQDTDLLALPTSEWSRGLQKDSSIGLFFGTRTALPEWLFPFCETMARDFSCSLEWLPWFPFHEILRERPKAKSSFFSRPDPNDLLNRIEKLFPRGEDYTQGDLLQALNKYQFVITDTYHLCINAWRAGVPAICFGSESDSGSQVIMDFKKKVLYEMFDAGDYYFDSSSLATSAGQQATAKRMIKLLRNEDQVLAVCARMQAEAESARRRLAAATLAVLS